MSRQRLRLLTICIYVMVCAIADQIPSIVLKQSDKVFTFHIRPPVVIIIMIIRLIIRIVNTDVSEKRIDVLEIADYFGVSFHRISIGLIFS